MIYKNDNEAECREREMGGWITEWDIGVLFYIQDNIRNDFLTPIMRVITHLGHYGIFWIALVLILLIFKRTRKAAFTAAIALLITSVLVNLIIKPSVARIRPYDAYPALIPLVDRLSDFSFPSGHTANGFAVAFVLFWMLPKKYSVWLVVLNALIALTRLYVCVHYPTDIIAGFLIGLAVSRLVWYFMAGRKEKKTADGRT